MRTKKHIKNGTHYLFATITVIFSNYFFHLITARGLPEFEYGILSGLFAFFGIIAFTSVSLQTKSTEIAARILARNNFEKLHQTQKKWIIKIFEITLILTLISYLGTYFLKEFFHTSLLNIILFLPVFCITLPLSAVRGFLQGQQKYKNLSQNFLLESFLKLLLAYISIKSNLALPGILAALTISQIPGFLWGLKTIFKTKKTETPTTENQTTNHKVDTRFFFWYFGLFAFWFNFDMISVQHFLPQIAGDYSVASKLGQVILFLTTNIGNFLFPLFIENTEKKRSNKKLILAGFALVIGSGVIGTLFLEISSYFLVTELFGIKYLAAKEWIKFFGIFGTFIGITHLQVQIFLAKGKFRFLYFLTIATVFFVLHFLWQITREPAKIFEILCLWSFVFSLIVLPIDKIKKIKNL